MISIVFPSSQNNNIINICTSAAEILSETCNTDGLNMEAKLKKQAVLEVFRIAMQLLTTNPSEDQEQDMSVQVEAAMALSRLAHIHQDKTGQFI